MNRNFKVDPVSVEVIRNAFISAARDMNAILIRGAYSEVIYEMKDCSVGIFDSNGDLLGQSPGLPVFLGILDAAKEITTVPVIGIGEAVKITDLPLGDRHGIIATIEDSILFQSRKAILLGTDSKLVIVRPLNLPVIDLENEKN